MDTRGTFAPKVLTYAAAVIAVACFFVGILLLCWSFHSVATSRLYAPYGPGRIDCGSYWDSLSQYSSVKSADYTGVCSERIHSARTLAWSAGGIVVAGALLATGSFAVLFKRASVGRSGSSRSVGFVLSGLIFLLISWASSVAMMSLVGN